MKVVKLLIVIIAIGVFIMACSESKPTNTEVKTNTVNTAAPPSPPDELTSGRQLYGGNCVACHRENGEGGKVTIEGTTLEPASLTSEKMKKRSDEKLFSEIADGVTDEGMPAFKSKLTDDQIRNVVKFIRHDLQKL